LVAACGVAAVATSYALALTSDHLTQAHLHATLFGWLSLSYVVCGLVAWRRRPDSRLGPLMAVAGFGPALSNLAWSANDTVESIGLLFDFLPIALFLHVFLAFPTGRLRGRIDRTLVVGMYAVALGGQALVVTLGALGPRPIRVVDAGAAAATLYNVVLLTISGICLAGFGVLAGRRLHGGRPRTRSIGLLVDTFALALVMVAVLLVWGFATLPGFLVVQRATLIVLGLAPLAFLVGLLDTHLARTGVGDLVIRLRTAPVDLRGALAQALRDPSLSLLYWLPQYRTWADETGRPAELPATDGDRAATVIDRDGEPVAALVHDPSLLEERALLDAVSAAAAIALDNGRLRADLHARIEEVRGSRARVIEAEHRERQRLERDLHDGAQQRLIALSLDLGLLEGRLGAADPESRAALAQAKREVATSLDELRAVARGLHPAVLTGHGLGVAVESLAARATVPITLHIGLDGRLPEGVEVAAYYVVSESLANIGKHSRAKSARVDVTQADGTLVVEVLDDGVGGADTERGTGLRGLADRVEALGGRLRIWTPPGGGTRVRAEIPCG
jgi:signal transduction histidine kinase